MILINYIKLIKFEGMSDININNIRTTLTLFINHIGPNIKILYAGIFTILLYLAIRL